MSSDFRARARTGAAERLEARTLLVALVFDATPGNDSIAVDVAKEVITVTLNGVESLFLDDAFDAIDVRGLGGDDAIGILSSGDNDIFVRGDNADGSGTGNDTIDVAAGNLDAVGAPVVVTAGGGGDVVRLNDQNNNFSDPFNVTATSAGRIFFGGLTYGTDLERLEVRNSRGGSTITVASTSPATNVAIDGGAGFDTIDVNDTDPLGPVVILPGAADDTVNVNGDGVGAAGVRFDEPLRVLRLSIGAGGRATIAPHGARVLTVEELFVSPGGTLDITDNAAVIDYVGASPVAQVQAQVTSGYNGGAWNGTGITSSTAAAQTNTAVGFAESTDLFTAFPASFAGASVDATAVLLRHTFYGDADLNRTVNLNDFNRLAANFGQTGRRWSQGDFDFSGAVNLNDFNRLAASFGLSDLTD
jgi:hypothetical protein